MLNIMGFEANELEFIRTMDLNELGVTIHPTPQEWYAIKELRHLDFTEEFIAKHWIYLPIDECILHELITFSLYTKYSSSKNCKVLSHFNVYEIGQVIDSWVNRGVFDEEDLKKVLYLVPEKSLHHIDLHKLGIEDLCVIFNNLHVSDKFLIERKELFWECTRKCELTRIFSAKLLRVFKLVPYRVIPEESGRFSPVNWLIDEGVSTKKVTHFLKDGVLLEELHELRRKYECK